MPEELRPDDYAWRLEVAVWSKVVREGDDIYCRPRLVLVCGPKDYEAPGALDVLGIVERGRATSKGAPPVWLVRHYSDSEDSRYGHLDEQNTGFQGTLEPGERRYPRPSAEEALKHLLELTADRTPKQVHGALTTTGKALLVALKSATESFVRYRETLTASAP